jgi:hypothetical protein
MMLWTIPEVSIRHRPVICTGGPGRYGGLELTACPLADRRTVEVEDRTQDPDAAKWFPHLRAGFEEYQAQRAAEGRPIGGVRLSVTKVYSHPVDTDEHLMRRLAAEALRMLFERHERAVEV